MSFKQAVELLMEIEEILRETYPEAFPKEVRPGCIMQLSRFGWEVRLGSGVKKLSEAADKLRSVIAEAEPRELVHEPIGKILR